MTILRPLVDSTFSVIADDIDPPSGEANEGDTVTFNVFVDNTTLNGSTRPIGNVSIVDLNTEETIVAGTLEATDDPTVSSVTLVSPDTPSGSFNLVARYPGVIDNGGISFKPSQSEVVQYTVNKPS